MSQVASQLTTAQAAIFARSTAAAGMLAANANTLRLTESISVAITAARAIKERSNVPHLPKQPDSVHGIFNLRGVVAPTIGQRCRFGQGE